MSGQPSPVWRRSVQRAVHLLPAIVLGTFVYAPVRSDPLFVLFVQVVVFPALVASGLLLWQGGRLRRWLRARRASGSESATHE
jgi:hypothetical protein